jgi:hypothetical protein
MFAHDENSKHPDEAGIQTLQVSTLLTFPRLMVEAKLVLPLIQ